MEHEPIIENNENFINGLEYFKTHRDALIAGAKFTEPNGVSYRPVPFKVSCLLLAEKPGLQPGEYAMYNTYNFKPIQREEHGSKKRCAERNAIEGAINNGCRKIIGLVTYSKQKTTGDENKSDRVLHCCKDCRLFIKELIHKGLMEKDSLICNAGPADAENPEGGDVYEERTAAELLSLYNEN